MSEILKKLEPNALFKQCVVGGALTILTMWALFSFVEQANYIYLSLVGIGFYRFVMNSEMALMIICALSVLVLKFVELNFV